MPRAVDPPGRYPTADMDPGARADQTLDIATFPSFDWLGLLRGWIHQGITFVTDVVTFITGGLIDLAPLHEALDEVFDDFVAGIGTGQNVMKIIKLIASIIKTATGIDLVALCAGIGGLAGLQGIASVLTDFMARITCPLTINQFGNILFDLIKGLIGEGISVVQKILSPLNGNLWNQIRGAIVPSRHVAEPSPELLDNPDFIGEVSIADLNVWAWDGGIDPGSARVDANGQPKTLISNPIQVTPGMVVPVSIQVNHLGMAATPNQNAIRLSVNRYDWEAYRLGPPLFLDGIASPAGSAQNVTLAGTYTAGGDDAWIAVRLDVTAAATAGTVWFHHASTKSTGFTAPQIPFDFVKGIAGIFDIGTTMQSLWDSMQTAISTGIPGVTAPGIITGASLADVAQSLHDLAANVQNALVLNRQTRIELGLITITPEDSQVTVPGVHAIPLPEQWDYVDLVTLGGGGGGGSLFGILNGQGGWCGAWNHLTLVRQGRPIPPGVPYDVIHQDATSVTATVGGGGNGGVGAAGTVGTNGGATMISWRKPDGSTGITAAAGGQYGGTSIAWNGNNPNGGADGIGPGTHSYNGRSYFGGTNVGKGSGHVPGSPPGGGGGAGILRIIPDFGTWGGDGAHGSAWTHAYAEQMAPA